VNLNLNRVLNIVGLGVRRAYSFMALGVRVTRDETLNSVVLDTNFAIHFMPQNLSLETVREVQKNFGAWIVGNGLRELDQATSLFADRVFEVRTLAGFHGRQINQAAIDNIANFENRTNVAEKLSVIAQQFGIDSDLRAHMPGLSKARNALTHNWGVVGVRHCTHDRELRLSWLGLEMSVGDKVIPVDFEQFRVEQGERLVVRTLVRERTIPINMLIDLSPYDLSEICLTYWSQAQKIIAELGRQIRELGIKPAEVGRSERPQEPDQNP
jgi:hypothetical protein